MASTFHFRNPDYSIPTVISLRAEWKHIPDERIQRQIAYEHQYLRFHGWLLKEIRASTSGSTDEKSGKELSLTVRVGAIKAAILLCGSIAEAALRAHAEKRGYKLPKDEKQRTFGRVLSAWKLSSNGRPQPDIEEIWDKLQELKSIRNNVHLHVAAGAKFEDILAEEEKLFSNATMVLKHLKTIQSP